MTDLISDLSEQFLIFSLKNSSSSISAILDNIFICISFSLFGANNDTIKSTFFPSLELKSIAVSSLSIIILASDKSSILAWGIAIPFPKAVVPNFSLS